MSFQVRGVDHKPVRRAGLSGQLFENAVEHTHSAPTHETIIQRLVRTVFTRRVLPLQSVLYYIDDPADYTQIIHARHSVRQREIRLDAVKLVPRQ